MVTLFRSPSTELLGIAHEALIPALRGPGPCWVGHPGQTNPPAFAGDLLVGIKLMKQGEAGLRQGLRNFLLREGFKDSRGLLGSLRALSHTGSGLVPWQCSGHHCGQDLGHKGA